MKQEAERLHKKDMGEGEGRGRGGSGLENQALQLQRRE
jgi:hypothetical protein